MSVYRRGRSWSWSLEVGRDHDGRRRKIYGHGYRTKSAAEAAREETAVQRRGGIRVDPTTITVAEYLTGWWLPRKMPAQMRDGFQGEVLRGQADPVGDHAGRVKPGTWNAYESRVRVQIVPRIGALRLQELTPADVDRLLDGMAADGRSPKTIKNTFGILKKALGDAVRLELLARNVCDAVDAPTVGRAAFDAWTLEEVQSFLTAIADDEHLAAWLVFINTGMRAGEVAGLTWANTDLEDATLAVRWSYTESRGQTLWSGPKTKKGTRRVALDAATVEALRRWRTRQTELRLAAGPAWQRTVVDSYGQAMSGVVFTHADGTIIRPQTWRRWLTRLCDANGIRPVSPHALRHTLATLALQRSETMADMKALSDRLGHATISFTLDRYADFLPDRDRALAERVAGLWQQPGG